ncbi:MAG: carbohydrate kinase family protein [Caldilineaceae bacterium]|nr:carbohydrate kinase family protein [Caldilineaceae bacterium]
MYTQNPPLDAISISDLTLDYILDPDGQPHLHLLGGKGVYAAVGMWLWGLWVGLAVSAGGDFDLSRLAPLQRAGIDIRGVQRHPQTLTVFWAQQYAPDGDRVDWNPHRHFAETALAASLPDIDGFSPPSVVRAHFVDLTRLPAGYDAASAYHFARDEFLRYPQIVAGWKARGALCGLDADWRDEPPLTPASADARLASLAAFNAILPSVEDIHYLFGAGVDLRQAARTLGSVAQSAVVVKLGGAGSLLYQPRLDRFDQIPVVPVKAVDPTGAGDAYAGGFLAGLLKTGDPLEASLWATVSASFVIEGYGAAYALGVDRREVQKRLAWLKEKIGRK